MRSCLFDEAAAEDIREGDRFISKVYALVQELAAEAVEEHDAKGQPSRLQCRPHNQAIRAELPSLN